MVSAFQSGFSASYHSGWRRELQGKSARKKSKNAKIFCTGRIKPGAGRKSEAAGVRPFIFPLPVEGNAPAPWWYSPAHPVPKREQADSKKPPPSCHRERRGRVRFTDTHGTCSLYGYGKTWKIHTGFFPERHGKNRFFAENVRGPASAPQSCPALPRTGTPAPRRIERRRRCP